MNIETMIRRLNASRDDLFAVITDLQDVIDGEITMADVNIAVAQEAIARTHSVVDAVKVQS